jgi:hypothetical protein
MVTSEQLKQLHIDPSLADLDWLRLDNKLVGLVNVVMSVATSASWKKT